jgi:hypothetical protein
MCDESWPWLGSSVFSGKCSPNADWSVPFIEKRWGCFSVGGMVGVTTSRAALHPSAADTSAHDTASKTKPRKWRRQAITVTRSRILGTRRPRPSSNRECAFPGFRFPNSTRQCRMLTNRPTNRKSRSEFLDPCQETAARSIQCLRRNDGDRSMCQDYFQ